MAEATAAPAPTTPAPAQASTTPAAPLATPSQASPAASGEAKAPKAGESKPGQVEAWKRAFRVQVDGAERELELDESAVVRHIQKAMAAEKRFSDAAHMQAEVKRLIQEVRDPTKRNEALSALLGGPEGVQAWAEELLAQKLQDQTLTEEQRAAKKDRQELERLRQTEKARAEAEKKASEERRLTELQGRLEKTVISLADQAGLPKEPWALELVIDVLRPIVENDIPMTQAQIVDEVKDALANRAKERDRVLGSNLKGKALLEYLGPGIVKEVLRATVDAHKPAPKSTPTPSAANEEEPKTMTLREFKRRMRVP